MIISSQNQNPTNLKLLPGKTGPEKWSDHYAVIEEILAQTDFYYHH